MGRARSTIDHGARARRSTSRWATLVVAMLTGALVAASASPASAATNVVGSFGELRAAIAACSSAPSTIVLGADVAAPREQLDVPCAVTIDLATYDLDVESIRILPGSELVVDGPVDGSGGTLTADPSEARGVAGIRTSGATLTVRGGTVVAVAGVGGAGIGGDSSAPHAGTLHVDGGAVRASSNQWAAAVGGGGYSGAGGSVLVTAGTLDAVATGWRTTAVGGSQGNAPGSAGGRGAEVAVTGGVLTATATSAWGTAIGGGSSGAGPTDLGGPGGTLVVGARGEVVAAAPGNAIGSGWDGSNRQPAGDFGSVRVDGILRLPSGRLWVGEWVSTGAEIVVGASGRVLGAVADPTTGAQIVGPGAIDNQGVIALDPANASILGNDRRLRFQPGGEVRVLAPTVAAGLRTIPAPPAGTAWNTRSDGLGDWFATTSSTAGTGILELFAVVPATMAVASDPAALRVAAGEPIRSAVTVLGPDGRPLAPQPEVTYASGDCDMRADGSSTVARSCTVTATTTVQGVVLQRSFRIEVVPAELATIALSPASTVVEQGATVRFVVEGADAAGNRRIVDDATLASTAGGDVVAGEAITFSGAGDRIVTATLGALTATASVRVLPGPLASLSLAPTSATVAAGEPVVFTVSGADAASNAVDASAAVLTSSVASDVVDGRTVTFSGLGVHVVTARIDGISTTARVDVVAGPVVRLAIEPSATSVAQGGSLTFEVTGVDAAGEPVDVEQAVLTSSVATDVVDGWTVSFPHASPHTITATLGQVAAAVTIEVIPSPSPSPSPTSAPAPSSTIAPAPSSPTSVAAGLPRTGASGSAVAVLGGLALAMLLVGCLLMRRRRRMG